MLKLVISAAAIWAAYRAGQAQALGVPMVDALLSPLVPVKALAPAQPKLAAV
jgi:hypothetical protein